MMKKIYRFRAAAIAAIALCIGFTSCGKDTSGNDPDSGSVAKFVTASVSDGAEVDADAVKEITVEYSEPIIINSSAPATLNGSAVQTALEGEKTLKATVALASGTDYTFEVPERTVITKSSRKNAAAVKISFKTKKVDQPTVSMALNNSNAIPQAKKVYEFLVENIGKKIVSGAMANVNNNNYFADWVNKVTGVYPGLTCYDFIHLPESGPGNWIDYDDLSAVEAQWNANGLVAYMWHWRVPTDKDAYDKKDYNRYGFNTPGKNPDQPTDFDIREALKEGTWQHDVIIADIDKVAAVFKKLQDKGIPVLWRPLHEAAGSYIFNNPWFWWGRFGGEYTKQLWNLMYDRLTNHHKLNNLIWVWTAQYAAGHEQEMAADYVGNDKCDIVGIDVYTDKGDDSSQKAAYSALYNMCGGKKPLVLAETGYLQNPDKCLTDGADWSYFMLWYTYNQHELGEVEDGFGNTPAHLKSVFTSPAVLNRSQLPSLK